jgi:hypothetical protein
MQKDAFALFHPFSPFLRLASLVYMPVCLSRTNVVITRAGSTVAVNEFYYYVPAFSMSKLGVYAGQERLIICHRSKGHDLQKLLEVIKSYTKFSYTRLDNDPNHH